MGRRLAALIVVALVATTLAQATPEHVSVRSPLPVEYNIVGGAIMLHIDTNYVVPNTKYSVTAEIERNGECKGCYNVYLVLHTPATPGYAWVPHKLAPILAVIHPDATEKNINIRVIPLGVLKNAESPVETTARCEELRAEVAKISAEIETCKILGCDENEVMAIREEWQKVRAQNIKMRCGIALPPPPHEAIEPNTDVARIVNRYVTQDVNIVAVTREGNTTHVETVTIGKILGILPVSVHTRIDIRGSRVSIHQPWWYAIFRWLIW